ncbi:helix-turn-helix transcriptional regulator [Streptococcus dentapri]|uniref:Helix-turn-helix transcriptional regulator n=1 Tax=Streptococcus dentapri TaxID=573564 RepID=A0ABV8D118_9STRE
MAEHLGDGVSLEKAAQHFHYAPSYFSRQFKKLLV